MEYLKKKTIAEIKALGEEFKIFEDQKAFDFMVNGLDLPLDAFHRCKKGQLIKLFLESGVDLAGKVPAEILRRDSMTISIWV